jgi:V8-like Glu-specific endopeptidase
MVSLRTTDRNHLIEVLCSLPVLESPEGRRVMLRRADLSFLIPRINLTGAAPEIVLDELVENLQAFGQVTYGVEALGLFLRAVESALGPAEPKRVVITRIIDMYHLLPATREIQLPIEETPIPTNAEKWVGENTFLNIAFLQRGLDVARAVALVVVRNDSEATIKEHEWSGTGFLVGQRLFLTNHHVLPTNSLLPTTIFRFNFQTTFDGRAESTTDYHARPGGIFFTHPDMDCTLIELAGDPGNHWGWLPLDSNASVVVGERVNIIQHPAGLPKRISMQNNFVDFVDHKVIRYQTATDDGSSGSPVFNDSWQLVAVHHGGKIIFNQSHFRALNEGIRASALLPILPQHLRDLLGKNATGR